MFYARHKTVKYSLLGRHLFNFYFAQLLTMIAAIFKSIFYVCFILWSDYDAVIGNRKGCKLIVGYAFLHTAFMSDLNSQALVTLLCSSTCAFLPSEYRICKQSKSKCLEWNHVSSEMYSNYDLLGMCHKGRMTLDLVLNAELTVKVTNCALIFSFNYCFYLVARRECVFRNTFDSLLVFSSEKWEKFINCKVFTLKFNVTVMKEIKIKY